MTLMRLATAEDTQSVSDLRREFWLSQFSTGLRDGRTIDESVLATETRKLISRPRSVLVVLENVEGNSLVGYAYATQLAAPHLCPPFVRSVEEIFVKPGSGRNGSGRALAEAALSAIGIPAARSQIRVIWENEAGRAFWSELGFQPSVLIMERGAQP